MFSIVETSNVNSKILFNNMIYDYYSIPTIVIWAKLYVLKLKVF